VIGARQSRAVLHIDDEVRHIRLRCRRRIANDAPLRIDAVTFRTSAKQYVRSLFQFEWLQISEDIQSFQIAEVARAATSGDARRELGIVANTAAADFLRLTEESAAAREGASELFEGEWARTFEDSSVDRQQYGMAPDRLLSEASNFQTRMDRTTEELSDFQKGIMEAMRRADAYQDRLGQERGGARTKNATKDEDIKWARMQATAIQSKLQLKNWARKEAWAPESGREHTKTAERITPRGTHRRAHATH
jgi:hypothetical protein